MNKLLITVFLVFSLSENLFAQTEQGIWMVGGQYTFNSENTLRLGSQITPDTKISRNAYGILPQVGYFFKKNWVIGVDFGYHHSRSSITNHQTGELVNRQNQWTGRGGVFLRRYLPINEQVYFHLQGGLAYTFGDIKTIHLQNDAIVRNTRALNMHTQAGITYFPKRWIAIEGNINPISYSFSQSKTPQINGEQKELDHSFSTGLNGDFLSLGFNLFISKPR
ncbi:hypothetical protein MM213_15355 [Belliella sp. R4-6]|uniref:Outer membrane protein beta-barrel domain-containing protein n=1 Tax=Belliella alkalica TaxID=1730871 RepID=A0ABS9VEL3_9BACT|nr:hypothetical protein [Belliella alkalica]MCH7414876.1 hypothetical protein [Belliella alkalica]